ncbi:MAG: hypothetical protein JWN71_506 [Xanthobacteraceae bacterium]|nr:hypothetical protein [Xanthobacteraceae bacterium]
MQTFAMKSQAARAFNKPNTPAHALRQTPAVRSILRGPRVQPKLAIGAINDPAEHEADRVADQVMRMPDRNAAAGDASPPPVAPQGGGAMPSSLVRRTCAACGAEHNRDHETESPPITIGQTVQAPGVQRLCAECEKEHGATLQRRSTGASTSDAAPPSVHQVLRSSGRPLDTATRTFMEPRFGRDFSQIRIHTDRQAAASARDVNALAYTVGRNVVFGTGTYAPHTESGRHLLAHELTHSLQQGQTVAFSGELQRACGPVEIGKPAGCTFSEAAVTEPRFLFDVNCDVFRTGHDKDLETVATTIVDGETVDVHGIASIEGDPDFNANLSCARALRAKDIIEAVLTKRGVKATVRTFHHGPLPGDAKLQRSVVLVRTKPVEPEPPKEEVPPKCGPDATRWFVTTVNMAMLDPDVLAIQAQLARAKTALSLSSATVDDLAEAGATTAILAQEARLGSSAPARTAVASSQIADGMRSVSAARKAATDIGIPPALLFIADAAFKWRALVNHGARFDFKAHVMNHPKGASCPEEGCDPGEVGIITLCPGAKSENCYESDLPGNLFYALIGRFIGWSLLTLQLGSQLAELTDTRVTKFHPAVTWDSPQDTGAIILGFHLPLPLTRSMFCGIVPKFRAALSKRDGCADCTDKVPLPPP